MSGRVLPLGAVVVTELAALVVYAVTRILGVAQLTSVGAAAGVGVLGVALVVSSPNGTSACGHLRRVYRFVRSRIRSREAPPAPFDVPIPDGDPVGLRWHGDRMIAVVRIARPVEPRVLLPGRHVTTGSNLWLGTVARALSQFDIELESIDVVAHGWRTRAAPHITAPYTTLTQDLPTVSHQDVWVVLRLNPLRCPDAISARGGGPTGVIRTTISATRRVANHLAREGYRTTILSAHGISAMDAQLVDQATPDAARESWGSIDYDGYRTSAFGLETDLADDTLTSIWSVPAISTTSTTTIERGGGADRFAVSTVVRYGRLDDDDPRTPTSLRPLRGRQRPAVAWSMPARREPVAGLPFTEHPVDTLDSVAMVDGSAGQLLGANTQGEAVSVPLFGIDVRRVDLYGRLYLSLQITLRAIATGARVVVRTDRPDAWRGLADSVDDPRTMFVTRSATDQRYPPNTFTLCILDSREATEDATIGTQLRIHRESVAPAAPQEGCDVAIYQDAGTAHRVHLSTRSGSDAITLVSVPAENALLGTDRFSPATDPATSPRDGVAVAAVPDRGAGGHSAGDATDHIGHFVDRHGSGRRSRSRGRAGSRATEQWTPSPRQSPAPGRHGES